MSVGRARDVHLIYQNKKPLILRILFICIPFKTPTVIRVQLASGSHTLESCFKSSFLLFILWVWGWVWEFPSVTSTEASLLGWKPCTEMSCSSQSWLIDLLMFCSGLVDQFLFLSPTDPNSYSHHLFVGIWWLLVERTFYKNKNVCACFSQQLSDTYRSNTDLEKEMWYCFITPSVREDLHYNSLQMPL